MISLYTSSYYLLVMDYTSYYLLVMDYNNDTCSLTRQ